MNKSKESDKQPAQEPSHKNESPERKARSGFFSRKRGRMEVAIQVVTVIAGLLVIATTIVAVSSFSNKFTITLWLGYATAIFLLLAGCLYWQKQHWENEKKVAPFEILVSSSIEVNTRALDLATGWYRWRASPLGDSVSPIHRMMVIRITNRQTVRSQIESYRVEAQMPDGRWVRLIWMNGGACDVYWMDDPRDAKLVDLIKLDSMLLGHTLAPNESVEGWAFFELPEDIPFAQPLRIYVKDYGGAETTQEVNRPAEFNQWGWWRPTGSYDLSKATFRYYSEVK